MTTRASTPGGSLTLLAAAHTPPLTPDEIRSLTRILTPREKARLKDVIDVDGILKDPELRNSDRIMRTAVGALRALGYDPAWLAAVTDLTVEEIMPPRRTVVPVKHMRRMLTVAARIGDRPATPESTGLTWEQIETVKAQARRSHYCAPACYDERYNYVTGVDGDGNSWGSALELARFANGAPSANIASKVRAAAQFMREGGTSRAIATRHGFTTRTWQRIVESLGIRCVRSGGGLTTVVSPAPGQDALRKATVNAVNALDMGADPIHVWTLLCADAEAIKDDQAAGATTQAGQDVAA